MNVGVLPGETGFDRISEKNPAIAALSLGAIGVVYGDIGTSPIYALRETVRAAAGSAVPTENEIVGALSIITWAITIVVALKYAVFVLRADNKGEGGTLAIMTLARLGMRRRRGIITAIGMVGAALFFGDAIITPAISVLSAVEGLEIAAPSIDSYVVAITITILVVLFSVQRFGTATISKVFGPIMVIWFVALGLSGLMHLHDDPGVVRALNPVEGMRFLYNHSAVGVAVIGAAFLAVTGVEALYVDLGHFGKKPILYAWFGLVMPCLLLNYFGQGAFLLKSNGAVDQPLFQMFPDWLVLPAVVLATAATVIASQAVISGAFSLGRQAMQLDILPRLDIQHTSETQSGQIYLPQINWLLLVCLIVLILGFRSSENLASAYGISVAGEMLVTTLLLFIVMVRKWHWSMVMAATITVLFLTVDITFLLANGAKLADGGWVSVFIALVLLLIMRTWVKGRRILFNKTRKLEVPLLSLVEILEGKMPHLVKGTAVFLTSDQNSAPTSLLHSLKHFQVLHPQNFILTVKTAQQPKVPEEERLQIEPLGEHFYRVSVEFGFMEDPNVPRAFALCRKMGLKFDIMTTTFFLSRRSLIASGGSGMPKWQDKLFVLMSRGASDATAYFRLPTGRVVEIGTQVVI